MSRPGRPLHELGPTRRFSARAADYARSRPGYPADAIDAVLKGLGIPGTLAAADVGAGTGISVRLLAERGVRVTAIEPNAQMREAGKAQSRLGDPTCPIEWCEATAEATGLADASVDLVLCAQSYHWFEPVAACREFGRILRPGGRLALMWNDADESDPVAREYYDLVREASTGVGPTSHQAVAKDPPMAHPFTRERMRRLRFRNEQRLDADGLVRRAMSASYVPKTGARAARLIEGLRGVHARHAGEDGCVELVYDVHLYLCEPGPG